MDEGQVLNRWRLVLGKYASGQISYSGGGVNYMGMEEVLDYLYSREYGEEQEIRQDRRGGREGSRLTVPKWLHEMKKLFPKETVEIMERHALEKYEMTELLTDPEVLRRLEPNRELLKTIMGLKHMMKGEVLQLAREIVRKVAQEIMEKLEQDVRRALQGRLDRTSGSPVRSLRNLDIQKTIRKNLQHYDQDREQLVLQQVYFHSRLKRYHQWRVVICVDESGSMLDSVIHSAIMAGIFARLPMLDTRLVIFDTNVVDLSGHVEDPVETLMSVQLGGGTNIDQSVAYCQKFVENPAKTLFFLITDLEEGGNRASLLRRLKELKESGVTVACLLAIADGGKPYYDAQMAERVASLSIPCFACSPQMLPTLLERALKGQDLASFRKEFEKRK